MLGSFKMQDLKKKDVIPEESSRMKWSGNEEEGGLEKREGVSPLA